jgi:hypothetical protein
MQEDLGTFLNPWYESLKDPAGSQECLLRKLLDWYKKTSYGFDRNADGIPTIEEFQKSFPIVAFEDLKPHIERVKQGNFRTLLAEPPIEWAMTRGTTGKSKVIPMTKTDLEQRVSCGARGLLNFVYRRERYEILHGYVLNLNFPSVVGFMDVGRNKISYGYSSGIYAKYNAEGARLNLLPRQEQIDALGGGITRSDWENRFESAYNEATGKNITMLIGVTQTIIEFGSFLKRRHGLYPKDLWNIALLICTSTSGINTRYKPALKGLYGDISIVEMYGATEGMYAQQLDEKPFVIPNYDLYLFEVETKRGVKMLYEMKRGEIGSLIVSSCLFPRYRIGDLIKCAGGNYYTVIGRDKRFTRIKHLFGSLFDVV